MVYIHSKTAGKTRITATPTRSCVASRRWRSATSTNSTLNRPSPRQAPPTGRKSLTCVRVDRKNVVADRQTVDCRRSAVDPGVNSQHRRAARGMFRNRCRVRLIGKPQYARRRNGKSNVDEYDTWRSTREIHWQTEEQKTVSKMETFDKLRSILRRKKRIEKQLHSYRYTRSAEKCKAYKLRFWQDDQNQLQLSSTIACRRSTFRADVLLKWCHLLRWSAQQCQ